MSLEPAKSIIERLGGPAIVSKITGTSYTAPYRWQQPLDKGGSGGCIPARHIPVLLRFAEENDLPLTPADFFILDNKNGAAT